MDEQPTEAVVLPRVAIRFCRQCKWNLRAAYYAQELLSTFESSIGEVALIPMTGGIFTVYLTHQTANDAAVIGDDERDSQSVLIWDRKLHGGFPETKILKQLIRDHIDPGKNLGHSDTPAKSKTSTSALEAASTKAHVVPETATKPTPNSQETATQSKCEDCA